MRTPYRTARSAAARPGVRPPSRLRPATAVTYSHAAVDAPIHDRIRDFSAAESAIGHEATVTKCRQLAADLETRLAGEPADRVVAALGGRLLTLDGFCRTRGCSDHHRHLHQHRPRPQRRLGRPLRPDRSRTLDGNRLPRLLATSVCQAQRHPCIRVGSSPELTRRTVADCRCYESFGASAPSSFAADPVNSGHMPTILLHMSAYSRSVAPPPKAASGATSNA